MVFCKNSFIGALFWHLRIYGYDFQKILQIYGYTFKKFLWIYGWYFYDLNGTTPYFGNSSYPPPPTIVYLRVIIQEPCFCGRFEFNWSPTKKVCISFQLVLLFKAIYMLYFGFYFFAVLLDLIPGYIRAFFIRNSL